MMNVETWHSIIHGSAKELGIDSDSVHLVVTSPPYPMIAMWDGLMAQQNPVIGEKLRLGHGLEAFELMHKELDNVWREIHRVLSPGGLLCINIGDATRSFNAKFSLYPNHARIINALVKMGFTSLPGIIWKKPTNAPNKFMGSGMLPAGAYVTLEHEWILIFRKGEKRVFKTKEEISRRRGSAYFWEKRNTWFSDVWHITGTRQDENSTVTRNTTASFPLEVPFRLINMFSIRGDTILDPFLGTGTTSIAAIICGRNSIGYEIDKTFVGSTHERIRNLDMRKLNSLLTKLLAEQEQFISARKSVGKRFKHFNKFLNLEVTSSHESDIKIYYLSELKFDKRFWVARYSLAE